MYIYIYVYIHIYVDIFIHESNLISAAHRRQTSMRTCIPQLAVSGAASFRVSMRTTPNVGRVCSCMCCSVCSVPQK